MSKYKEIVNEKGTVIERENGDGTFSYIPTDLANSDYQEYLNPSETKTK
jgi:hypothetical protein